MTFIPGDVVILKHGGLPMTVEYIDGAGNVNCAYFSTGGKLHRDYFTPDMLQYFINKTTITGTD